MKNYLNLNTPIIQVHIADIHFGCVNPKEEYTILQEQFLKEINKIPFHILAVDGDLFHKKYMANSEPIFYAMKFIHDCVNICKTKHATMIILGGTKSHDADQLKIFNNYLDDPNIDIRIIEQTSFVEAFGLKILCIPEEYGKGKEYYFEFLSQAYDCCFFHGTMVGSVYGANKPNLDSQKYPIFDINAFSSCRGPILGGHVHKAMCLNNDIYYISNPIRFQHGEEEEKGFGVVVLNPNNGYYYHFVPIKSYRYDTIHIKSLASHDPNDIIKYLNDLKRTGIDHIRLDFTGYENVRNTQLIIQHFGYDPAITFKSEQNTPVVNTTQEVKNKYSDCMDNILDPSIDEYNKIVYFINKSEGKDFITVNKLKEILNA